MNWPTVATGCVVVALGALLWVFARGRPKDVEVSQPQGMSSVPGIMYGGRADNPRTRLLGWAWLIGGFGVVMIAVGLFS